MFVPEDLNNNSLSENSMTETKDQCVSINRFLLDDYSVMWENHRVFDYHLGTIILVKNT